jgi:hypothetical protein
VVTNQHCLGYWEERRYWTVVGRLGCSTRVSRVDGGAERPFPQPINGVERNSKRRRMQRRRWRLRAKVAWFLVAWALQPSLLEIQCSDEEGRPGAQPPIDVAHPAELLVRVFLRVECDPGCRASEPVVLKASVSGLAPGVNYAIVYNVQARRRHSVGNTQLYQRLTRWTWMHVAGGNGCPSLFSGARSTPTAARACCTVRSGEP